MFKKGFGEAIFFLSLIFLVLLNPVFGKFISITTNVDDIFIEGRGGEGGFTVSNQGDESAYEVSVSLILPTAFSSDDIFIGKIDPARLLEEKITIEALGEPASGVYPGALIVNYEDANSYPFSAVTPFRIVIGKRTTSNVIGVIDELTLAGSRSRKLRLHLKNPDKEAHDLLITLYLPRELNSESQVKNLTIPGASEAEIDFSVSSFSALPGSTYAVFASISYIKDANSYTAFTRGVIRIEEEKSIFSNQYLIAAIIVLLAVLLYYQLRGKST